ncbi:MAG TPA: hypothetical protein VF190_09820 [Rhodothermales bacterium]
MSRVPTIRPIATHVRRERGALQVLRRMARVFQPTARGTSSRPLIISAVRPAPAGRRPLYELFERWMFELRTWGARRSRKQALKERILRL